MAPEPHTATPASAGRMAPTGTQRVARLLPAPCARGAEGHPGRGRAGRPSGRPLGQGGGGAGTGGGGGPARGPRGSSPPPLPLTRTRGPWSRAPAEASTSSPGQTTRRALGQKEENGNFSHGVRSEPLPGDHDPHATVRPACPTRAEGPLVAGPALTWAQLSPQEAEGHVWGSTRSHSCPRPAGRSPDTGCPGGGPGRPPTWISAARGRSACLPTRHRAGAHGRWAC